MATLLPSSRAATSAAPGAAAASPIEPFINPQTDMREFTVRAVITGTVLGMIFGASSLYLVLKVGLTVSASIPVAVIALALFRGLSKLGVRDSTILENNITQTAGSAGESIAFGIGVTMPAILILGFDLELTRVLLVAALGGLLGILMMIPLRRALIVKEHATLKYPEGTACAAVLKAGATPEDRAQASPSAQAEIRAAAAAGLGAAPGAKVIFTGLRHRADLQDAERRAQRLEGHSAANLRRAVESRFGEHGDLARAARRRLHHRPAHRLHHGRRRRARVSRAHSADQVLRRIHPRRRWRPARSRFPR